jgi:hypothetical protein
MPEQQHLRRAIQRAARDGRASCRQLLEIAERTGTPPREIGRLCDEMNVHIANCQLGCFR